MLGKQKFSFRVQLLVMCRGELSGAGEGGSEGL